MESPLLQLPEDIFHRIIHIHLLSDPTITIKAAIRLSLVSKEFLTAVQRRPVLSFNGFIDHVEQEPKYLVSTLTRYHKENIHLHTFRFTCFSDLSDADRIIIDQFIELAAAKNLGLKNLRIWLHTYVLPKPVFEAESLVQLELSNCSLQPGKSIIMWHNLKRLSLRYVKMGDKKVLENILRGCPLLEFLEISYCSFKSSNSNVKVSNLGYLKKLDIQLYLVQTFELGAAPNLECLECSRGDLRFLGKYEHHKLKSIKLSSLRFNGDFLINLAHHFPVLEELTLSSINLEKINISSPSLKTIKMTYIQGLQEASFDVPNVVLFTIFDNLVVPKLSFAGNSGGWTCCITFTISNASIDTSWFLKLKEFLAAINMPEASIRIYFYETVTIFFMEARAQKSDVSFPGIIRDLTILTTSSQLEQFPSSFAREILDIGSPQRIMIQNGYDHEFPMVLYDHLMLSNVNSITRNVTRIEMNGLLESRMSGSWHQVLEQPQVSDRDKVMELFKVDDDDDRKNKFTISFYLKYYWGGTCPEQGSIEQPITQ